MNSNQVKVNKNKDFAMELSDSKVKSTPIAMVAPELKQNTEDTEITKTCAVLGCEDSKNLDPEMFFRFPEEPSLRQIWTDLTGRNNWTPTDYSYICIQHFSVDCFMCNDSDEMVLVDKAVPSQKLPNHVLEVEYIDEDSLEEDEEEYLDATEENTQNTQKTEENTQNTQKTEENTQNTQKTEHKQYNNTQNKPSINIISNVRVNNFKTEADNIELLKLFTEVQKMQRQCVALKDKLKFNMRVHNRQNRFYNRIKKIIEMKKKILNQKKKKKCRILLSLQDKIKEDTTGLVLAMPMRQTEDLKNFALSIYKYSPQAYIYIRNTLRTMLPSTEVLDSWITAGYQPKNVMTSSNTIKMVAEQTETELSCKVTLG